MNRSASAVKIVQALVVALGLIVFSGTGSPANANQSGPTVGENANMQKSLCELAGGTATMDVGRTVGDGLIGITVKCTGGLLDGMDCYNLPGIGSGCNFPTEQQSEQPHTVDQTAEPGSIEEVEIVEDVLPADGSVDPVTSEEPVIEEPVVEDEPVDPLPPLVDESPLDETIPDIEVVEADPVVSDEPVVEDIPQIEVVDGDVIPLQEIQEDLPEFEPAQ